MQPSFHHEDVFPAIARVILNWPAKPGAYVTHDQIVAALMSGQEGSALVSSAREGSKWATGREVASNMVAWFSQQITIGASSWGDPFDRKRQGGAWAYRPKTMSQPLGADVDLSAIEGTPQLFFHVRRERDPALRKAKIAAILNANGQLRCESCGLVTSEAFPGLTEDILEVHHRVALSASECAVINSVDDLALLCPNCHRAIHRTKPMMTVKYFRSEVLRSNSHTSGSLSPHVG